MEDPLKRPVLRVSFELADGTKIERDFRIDEVTPGFLKSPPDWLAQPLRQWDHPQDPITLSGRVMPGHEDEARLAVFPE